MSGLTVRGRCLSADDLALIRAIAGQAGQTRSALSVAVCARLGWTQPNGRPWDMACRYLLRRLEQQGIVVRGSSARGLAEESDAEVEFQCSHMAFGVSRRVATQVVHEIHSFLKKRL